MNTVSLLMGIWLIASSVAIFAVGVSIFSIYMVTEYEPRRNTPRRRTNRGLRR